ncbi:anaphase-promoting complex subunit 10-like [Metopolophium dirhodum]|uniref:anaphase-promoting complex subunit 10-like n=1 Tax=Metopolophium dirhodum TaxID=44670 RepID=UPI00298FC334|nr:anaphase-promoting complex subunit 10-like [Metopolophium dirhodum]
MSTSDDIGLFCLETIDPMRDVRAGLVREVGSLATWSVSSCKSGFGVNQLRDENIETYWQSCGQLPHLVNIQFRRKTIVSDIYMYVNHRLDESYTPNIISIRAGTNFNDLQEVELVELLEPYSWIRIKIKDIRNLSLKTHLLQIAVLKNHQNGNNCHIRLIKIHSPISTKDFLLGNFSTVEMRQYTTIK